MIGAAATLLSPAGPRARLSILIFHRVLERPDPLSPSEPDTGRFASVCGLLRKHFNVLPLDEAVQQLRDGTLPARAAAITFDDGYADNHDQALPVLLAYGLPATFFVATGFLDGGRMWNDSIIEAVRLSGPAELALEHLPGVGAWRLPVASVADKRAAIAALLPALKYLPQAERELACELVARAAQARPPSNLMMRSDQVLALRRAGMQVGGHTVTHPILTRLDTDAARREIEDGKAQLEAILGERVTLIAYPNGKLGIDYAEEHRALVRVAGFEAAVATDWGAARHGSDPYQLPRFTPWDQSMGRFGTRMVANLWRS